jgi:hypothetical protein
MHALAQYSTNGGGGGISAVGWIIYAAVVLLYIASLWVVFTKAGHPGWAAIIPIYNLYILLKVAGRPGWWLILYIIPIVNFVILIIVDVDVAKSFGKGTGFGIGLVFLPFIFFPILAWGDARYLGPAGGQGGAMPSQAPPPPPPPPAPTG